MINKILIGTRNIVRFSFTRPLQGDNALATIKDVNSVVNAVNNMFGYRTVDIAFTQSGQSDPNVKMESEGDPDCIDCDLPPWTPGDVVCGCSGKRSVSTAFTAVNRTGPGVYELIINPTCPAIVNMTANGSTIGSFVEALPSMNAFVTVNKSQLAQNKLIINTFAFQNNAWVASDNILNKTVIQFRIYGNWK